MADITMSQSTELADLKLRKVAMRLVKTAMLAAEKAVAYHAEPANFPITPDLNSLEQIFLSRFKGLHPALRQAAVARLMHRVKASATIRNGYYGDLANVDLHSATSVEAQAKALPFPADLRFPLSHLQSITILHGQTLFSSTSGLASQQTTDKLELRIHKVQCLDETNGFLGSEWGEDEIYLGGTTVDETGDIKKVSSFKVGDFDDDDVKTYSPPKQFTTFSLREGTTWPKYYWVTLVLAEVDMGGLNDFVNTLLKKIKDEAVSALAAATGVRGLLGGAVGAATAAVVTFVLGKIVDWLTSWWNDEIFPPVTVSISIPSFNARWSSGQTDSPQHWIRWWGYGGEYKLWYDWRLFS